MVWRIILSMTKILIVLMALGMAWALWRGYNFAFVLMALAYVLAWAVSYLTDEIELANALGEDDVRGDVDG